MIYDHTPLGKKQPYIDEYQSELLATIPRDKTRKYPNTTYKGHDLWIAYEISWLSLDNKPNMAVGLFVFPCDSKQLIESKSMKLYLHSLNQTHFESIDAVSNTLQTLFTIRAEAPVSVQLIPISDWTNHHMHTLHGQCLDHLPIYAPQNEPCTQQLISKNAKTQSQRHVYTNLFKSNCRVTGQPDWATISINYHGEEIDESSLLTYLLSYRKIQAFHEPTIERIYHDIHSHFKLSELSITGFFTRRGGIAICPTRSNKTIDASHLNHAILVRQ